MWAVNDLVELVQKNPDIVQWILMFSVSMFFGTIILVPWLITRIPNDYFTHKKRDHVLLLSRPKLLHMALMIIKNFTGAALVLLGILLLVLPGQGILTIVTGLMFLDFPGKFRVERWLASRHRVRLSMDWIRRRAGKEPLQFN